MSKKNASSNASASRLFHLHGVQRETERTVKQVAHRQQQNIHMKTSETVKTPKLLVMLPLYQIMSIL